MQSAARLRHVLLDYTTKSYQFLPPRPPQPLNLETMKPSSSVMDVTKPGDERSRGEGIKAVEELGSMPIIYTPWLNKGTNFSESERREKHLDGLLPPVIETLDDQAARLMTQLRNEDLTNLQRNNILKQIMATHTTLFYKALIENIEELAPIVYTPTIGEACQRWSTLFREPLGMYISAFRHRGRFDEVLGNWPNKNVQIIVVTDGSRILGLGDLGTNGIGISIGKIALYVAAVGFHPEHSLPIVLDMGCNRKELREDGLYLGERRERLEGEEYYAAIDEFCAAVKRRWPHALLQFEDFETSKAFKILEAQRSAMLCFNDDIQGTGAVVTSGFINGMKYQGTRLRDARVVFYGAGSSAVGVAKSIVTYMHKTEGISEEEARACIYMVDSKGLITDTRGDELPEHKQEMARRDGVPDMKDLREIVEYVKPHALIGLSAAGPVWTEPIVQALCQGTESPLVFPLSNPTPKAEISAENAYSWSKGRCIFAGGSPFKPVKYDGQTFVPGQANNVFVFPGIGFGAIMAKASSVNDEMFVAAAAGLADAVSEAELRGDKRLYPQISNLRQVSLDVAAAVAKAAWDSGVSQLKEAPADWRAYVEERQWWPDHASKQSAATA
uniref:Malic enzyme n=1 Tax=Auxenochlorella protothecoides TaxID=3075 RepID=A0A1D1ZWR8_AUXPR